MNLEKKMAKKLFDEVNLINYLLEYEDYTCSFNSENFL